MTYVTLRQMPCVGLSDRLSLLELPQKLQGLGMGVKLVDECAIQFNVCNMPLEMMILQFPHRLRNVSGVDHVERRND
jgi:hypothetical protein